MAEQTINTAHLAYFVERIPAAFTAEQATRTVANMRRMVGSQERPIIKGANGTERVNDATLLAAIAAICERFGVPV